MKEQSFFEKFEKEKKSIIGMLKTPKKDSHVQFRSYCLEIFLSKAPHQEEGFTLVTKRHQIALSKKVADQF